MRSMGRSQPSSSASRSRYISASSPNMRQKSLPVPVGKGQIATFGSCAAPHTHSLKVPSPPQAYTRRCSPEAASARILAVASIGARVTYISNSPPRLANAASTFARTASVASCPPAVGLTIKICFIYPLLIALTLFEVHEKIALDHAVIQLALLVGRLAEAALKLGVR